jgi:hypothetical protein
MAKSTEQQKGFFERGSSALEKIHYAIGAVALVAGYEVVAIYEFAHGLVWNWLKKRAEKNRQKKAVSGAGALAVAHAG